MANDVTYQFHIIHPALYTRTVVVVVVVVVLAVTVVAGATSLSNQTIPAKLHIQGATQPK